MNVLVTGAAGLLGAHVVAALTPRHAVVGADIQPAWGGLDEVMRAGDLQDPSFREELVEHSNPDVIIHCAAMVDVDRCEHEPARAYALNAELSGALARLAPPGCLFVYITTDSIFAGNRPLVTETELPCPRTVYARSKLHGEWEAQLGCPRALVVRTNFYGWSSGRTKTFGEWLYGSLERGEAITLFDDIHYTPVYVVDLARGLAALIEGGQDGIVHLCGRDRVSKYEFGMRLATAAGFSPAAVRRGSFADVGRAASRPKDMSLASTRFERLSGLRAPSCDGGLARFVADRLSPLTARFESTAPLNPGT